jgi:hypothetical protein
VGRNLPQKERKEIEDELRSLIQDQLDDRYKGSPTDDDVVELLEELGEPRKMAASYGREQYLIGPDLYPTMVRVLQHGWMLVSFVVVFVSVLLAFLTSEENTLLGLFLDTVFAVVQANFIYSGIVVLIFAIRQHTGGELEQANQAFNPLDLPPVDDPAAVERGEVAASIAFGIFGVLVFTYFLRVGGLTLRFNLSDPGEVLPVPTSWLIAYLIVGLGLLVINAVALRRGRWSVGLLLAEAGLEVVGAFASYYILIKPLFGLLFEAFPALANLPFADYAPEITAVVLGVLTLADTFSKLVKILWGGRGGRPFISVETES